MFYSSPLYSFTIYITTDTPQRGYVSVEITLNYSFINYSIVFDVCHENSAAVTRRKSFLLVDIYEIIHFDFILLWTSMID